MTDPNAPRDEDVPEAPTIPADPTELKWLTPQYRPDEHGLYLKRLMKALADNTKTGPRNIALTGSYGSGKSSVLEGLLGKWRYHAVRISLSTINPANFPPTPGKPPEQRPSTPGEVEASDSSARMISNVIQKEIVKQILYRETRRRMSGSRFRRIEKFHWLAAVLLSIVAAVVIAAIAYLANWTARFEQLLAVTSLATGAFGPWPLVAAAVAGLALVLLIVQRGLHGRIRVKALSAGTAQIELKEDESAFDRYLDEIVYFFSVSRCTVAIFEDLDRFQRIEIYEELRSLNVLLNSSRQLRRPVRFVYAMRDSLFEEISDIAVQGRSADAVVAKNSDDAELRTLIDSAADRAKFFDLVLPMVPFATLRTSLDLWLDELPDSTLVSRAALRIAARHVHDMRLIRNVSNEFHVFSEELTKNKIGGLRADQIFALMLYKNIYLDDFEVIRTGASALDEAERIRQDTITDTLFAWDAEDEAESDGSTVEARREAAASTSGAALINSIQDAYRTTGRAVPQAVVFRVGAASFDSDGVSEPAFWQALSVQGWAFQIIYGTTTPRPVERSLAQLSEMIGFDPSELDWSSTAGVATSVHTPALRDKLQRAELKDLLEDDQLLSEADRTSLGSQLRELFDSDLVYELVSAGLIDQNFSLYVSRFYGRTTSATAMNFILHVAQPGRFVPLAKLGGPSDVEAVLAEMGEDLLTSPAALNVNLFNALMQDARIDSTIDALDHIERGEDFLDLYLQVGTDPAGLSARLARTWAGTFRFLTAGDRPEMAGFDVVLNSALSTARAELAYEPAPRLAGILAAKDSALPVLIDPDSSADAAALVDLMRSNNGLIEDLARLSPKMRDAFVADGRFVVTAENFEASIGESNSWSLDLIPDDAEGVLNRALTDLDEYLAALPKSVKVLTKQKGFAGFLARIFDESGIDGIKLVLGRTSRPLVVNDLTKVPSEIWKELASDGRIASTPENLEQYRVEFGLDDAIAKLLAGPDQPARTDLAETDARVLAVAILALDGVAPTKKIRYLRGLTLATPLTVEEVASVSGEVVSYLPGADLIADTAATYLSLRSRAWPTRAAWIRRAPAFSSYIDEISFTDSEMWEIFRGDLSTTKKALVARAVASHPDPLSARTATTIGRFLLPSSGTFPTPLLDALAKNGCETTTLIRLLDKFQVQVPRLTERLALMPKPWRDLSGRDARKPLIPMTQSSIVILQRLKDAKIVASWGEPKNGYVRVQVRKAP